MSATVLGIDIGTGGSRALLIGDDGVILASATAEHAPFVSKQAAWAEQDPHDWWTACRKAIRSVLTSSGVSPQQIACVGLSGQMHGTVVLDEAGAVLRPSIIWCDQRGEEDAQWLEETVGARRLLDLTSNPALTNFTLIKLLWLRRREPETWRKVRHLLLPKDYVRFCLSGEYAIDAAEASGTLLLDVSRRKWSEELLGAVEIDRRILPGVFESPEICARVSRNGAGLTGLPEGTPIVAGAGDQAANAVGIGLTHAGAAGATIGTSGVVFAATDRPILDPRGRLHTFCHAIPGRWHVMGVTQAAGLSLRWFRDTFQTDGSYARLTEEAALSPPGADGVLWAPYLMGERTPYRDPNIRGALIGIAAHHTRAHVVRAIMEGVAFSLRDTLTIFSELQVPVERIRLSGGGARSPLWRQIQADIFGHAVETVQTEEGAAFGAALLAAVGAGFWKTVDEACSAVIRVAESIDFRSEVASHMNERYKEYRRLYPALHGVYTEHAYASI
ncbi:MAG: xylulokinase [Terriglobia bacterium]|nr:MAG: xylulokinase [Terriglobia bacterium]